MSIGDGELPENLAQLLKIQGYLYPDQHGQYTESREPLYQAIKEGKLFVDNKS